MSSRTREMKREIALMESLLANCAGLGDLSRIESLYREAISRLAVDRYEQHHQRRPGGLRARRRGRQARDEAGYCRHGVYVGGCGVDWMCGICETSDEDWLTSRFSKSERVRLERSRRIVFDYWLK